MSRPMGRLGPRLGAAAAGAVAAVANALGFPLVSLAVAAAVAGVVLWRRATLRTGLDLAWPAPESLELVQQVPTATRRPDVPPARRVAVALGRVDARELALSPWFGAGVGFCLLLLAVFTVLDADEARLWAEITQNMSLLAHPLAGMTLLASSRNVTRARRDGVDELLDSCPAPPATRAAGALLAAWVAVAALAVFFAAYLPLVHVLSAGQRFPAGPAPAAVPNLVSALVLGAGGAALGVAVGRWVRLPFAPPAALLLVGFVSLQLALGEPGEVTTQMLLSTFPPATDAPPPILTPGEAWLRCAWLAALTAATGAVAVGAGLVARRRPG